MCDEVLLHQLLKIPIAKMLTSITMIAHGVPKRANIVSFKNLTTTLWSLILHATASTPLGHIVHSNQDVQIAKRVWERSHEINAPHVENLNNQNGIEGHHR